MARKVNNMEVTSRRKIFKESANMETQTVYHENGSISTYPCDYERDEHNLTGGAWGVRQRGSMWTNPDGESHFTPYRHTNRRAYRLLHENMHGEVCEYKNYIVVRHKIKKCLGKDAVADAYEASARDVEAFIRSRKTETEW